MGCGASQHHAVNHAPESLSQKPGETSGVGAKSLAGTAVTGSKAPQAVAASVTGQHVSQVYGKYRSEIKLGVKFAAALIEATGMPGAKAVAGLMKEVTAYDPLRTCYMQHSSAA